MSMIAESRDRERVADACILIQKTFRSDPVSSLLSSLLSYRFSNPSLTSYDIPITQSSLLILYAAVRPFSDSTLIIFSSFICKVCSCCSSSMTFPYSVFCTPCFVWHAGATEAKD